MCGVLAQHTLVVGMAADGGERLAGDGRDVGVADEQQQRCLGVAPDEVAQELVKSTGDDMIHALLVLRVEDLALTDEDVPVTLADKDSVLPVQLKTSPAALPSNWAFSITSRRSRVSSSSSFALMLGLRSRALRALRRTARTAS